MTATVRWAEGNTSWSLRTLPALAAWRSSHPYWFKERGLRHQPPRDGNVGAKGRREKTQQASVGGSLVRQSVCQHRGGRQEGPRKLLSEQGPHNHKFYQNVLGTLKARSGSKIQPSLELHRLRDESVNSWKMSIPEKQMSKPR